MDTMDGEGYDVVTNEGWRVSDLIEFCAPRLKVRGDKEPADWKPGALRPKPRPGVGV